MAGAGRMHAVESGKDLNTRLMIAFGGNGPLHATRVARRAQVDRIVIPRDPGVGSAVGFLFAPVSFEIVRSRYATLAALDVEGLNAFFEDMMSEAQSVVRAGVPDGPLSQRRAGFMRYHGQGHEIEIPLPDRALTMADIPALREAFETEYSRQFSRAVPGMTIEILNWAVEVSSKPNALRRVPDTTTEQAAKPTGARQILCDVTGALRDAFIYELEISGCTAKGRHAMSKANTRLQVMWNRLLAVVEEQGQALIRAAFSPIVRECGDISAGIFDARGRMLAQAVTGTPGHGRYLPDQRSVDCLWTSERLPSDDAGVSQRGCCRFHILHLTSG